MFLLMTLRPREASTLVSECGYRNSASAEPSASVAYCSWLLAFSRIDPAGLPVAGLGVPSFFAAASKMCDQPPSFEGR